MDLMISPAMKERLQEAFVEESEIRRVFEAQGGAMDPVTGIVVKGGQVGAITLWLELRPAENGFCLENFYFHRIAVDGVPSCPAQ